MLKRNCFLNIINFDFLSKNLVETLRNDLSRVENEKAELKSQYESETANYTSTENNLRQEISVVHEQLNGKLTVVASLENQLFEVNTNFEALRNEKTETEIQLEDLKQRLAEALSAQQFTRELTEKYQST